MMKVYIIEVGEYSDRFVDIVFATRELAEAYINDRERRRYEDAKAQHETFWAQFPPDVRPSLVSRMPREFPELNEWVKSVGQWNDFGDITEYEVWDVVPVADVVS